MRDQRRPLRALRIIRHNDSTVPIALHRIEVQSLVPPDTFGNTGWDTIAIFVAGDQLNTSAGWRLASECPDEEILQALKA